jgi:hypothetical protein
MKSSQKKPLRPKFYKGEKMTPPQINPLVIIRRNPKIHFGGGAKRAPPYPLYVQKVIKIGSPRDRVVYVGQRECAIVKHDPGGVIQKSIKLKHFFSKF